MADFILAANQAKFPVGTTVGVYGREAFPGGVAAPIGAPITTAVVAANGTTTFTGLAVDKAYFAAAEVSGSWRRTEFRTAGLGRFGDIPESLALGDGEVPAWDASSESWTSLSVATRGELPFNVKAAPYSAVGDGATNDTAAIQAAIDAAEDAGGGVVYLPRGTYYIATGLTLPSEVELVGDGRRASVLSFADVATIGLAIQGTAAASVTVSTDIAEGDTAVTVSSATGFAAGSVVVIQGSDLIYGAHSARVASVAGNVLTLEDPMPIGFTVATHTPRVTRLSAPVEGAAVRDLGFKMAVASPTTRTYFIRATYTADLQIDRCRFHGLQANSASAVYVESSLDPAVRDNLADTVGANGNVLVALPFDFATSTGVIATGNVARRCGSGVTLSGCPRATVIGNKLTGEPSTAGRGIKVYTSPFSVVKGNVVENFGATYSGIRVVDSAAAVIAGNTIARCGESIEVTEEGRVGVGVGVIVEGNTIRQSRRSAIRVTALTLTTSLRVLVKGNNIDVTDTSAAVRHAVMVSASECVIEGNIVRSWGTAGQYGIWHGSGVTRNVIRQNVGFNAGAGVFINSQLGAGTNVIYENHAPLGEPQQLHAGDLPDVTGSRGGNAALASLLTLLATQGRLTDASSA